jgi:GDPmannose 4,6-dehydratase
MDRVLVIGAEGQDGKILLRALESEKTPYVALGKGRAFTSESPKQFENYELTKRDSVEALVKCYQPVEIYYLAAVHGSSEELADGTALMERSQQVNAISLGYVLEAVRSQAPSARTFYACTSHIFGTETDSLVNESSSFEPDQIYGMTKLMGHLIARYYRKTHGLFVVSGILFNHESPYRRDNFVSQRIARGVVAIKHGKAKELVVGDLSAEVDWGYAPDYVEAMRRTLKLSKSDEYIIASGERRTVGDFVDAAFEAAGLSPEGRVREDKGLLQKKRKGLIGDPTRLRAQTGWSPKTSFAEMVRILVNHAEEATTNG